MNSDEKNGMNEASADRVAYLVAGYIRQTLSEKEHDELDGWITASDENQQLFEELTDPATIQKGLHVMEKVDEDAARERIKSKISFSDKEVKRGKRRWMSYSTAAAIVLGAGLIIFFMVNRKSKTGKGNIVNAEIIKPGRNQATLILADGRTINLLESKKGLIDSTKGNEVLKTADGQINYIGSASSNSYHILTTPAGGQYSVLLPDSTRVWLNSSSSLKYPVSFSANERVVELSGEAYFEVAHLTSPGLRATPSEGGTSPGLKATPSGGGQQKIPFIVKVGNTKVEVVGTHFNINAYSDEPSVSCALLEGKVRVSSQESGVGSQELKPGEQAKIDKQGTIAVTHSIDADEVLAWKNGLFIFKNSEIATVMRQIGRWYDAEIIYEGKVDHHFNATIYRNEPIEKLLYVLSETNEVHFKVEGKKIVVRR
jgi:transmembrane sensor